MTEFLFKKSHYTNADSEKDRRGVHKIGDFINYKPDGWSANWPNVGDYANHFVCVRCPEITFAEAEAADYRKPWRDNFDYEIISSQPAQGQYTVRVFNKNTSPSGKGQLTLEKVDNFLTGWGCSDISFSAGSVTFTFNLWNAVRSSQFWDIDSVESRVNFTLISYSGATGVGVIQVEIVNQYSLSANQVINRIESRGGTITENNYPIITFQIERSDVLTRFRQDVKQKTEQVYKRHQYSISSADMDSIVAAGGVVTMSRAELLSKLINHLEI